LHALINVYRKFIIVVFASNIQKRLEHTSSWHGKSLDIGKTLPLPSLDKPSISDTSDPGLNKHRVLRRQSRNIIFHVCTF